MSAFELFYLGLMLVIVAYGAHRYWLAWGSYQARRCRQTPERRDGGDTAYEPHVLLQLPIYNEEPVVKRLIRTAAELDYPHEKLQIQVLDDSDDGSEAMIAEEVQYWRERGVPMEHVRREQRTGYKAGALEAGLLAPSAEFVAIFDADFLPSPKFIR